MLVGRQWPAFEERNLLIKDGGVPGYRHVVRRNE